MEICPKCGLPKEACVCETLAKTEQKVRIGLVKKRYGKFSTVIEGITDSSIDMHKMAKQLKEKLVCGGTVKEGKIELQGDHRKRVKELLIELGFPEETIE